MTNSLYAEFHVIPGHEARVRDLVRQLSDDVRAEPGNITFEAFTLESDPCHYFVFEMYDDDAAFAAHLSQEHGRIFNAELTDLVVGGSSTLTWLTPA